MASKSQFINRPWVGWYDDADILQITLASPNSTDGVKFTTFPAAHGYITNDNVQFLAMKQDGGLNEGERVEQIKVYNSLGYKGKRPKGTADGIIVIDANEFWLGAEEWPFSGDAEGLVVKNKFKSDWVAAFNPVVYEFVRGDDNVNDILLTSPSKLVMDTLVAADFPANRKIKLRDKYSLEVQGDLQDGVFSVLSATGSPATVTLNETLVQVNNKFGLVVIDELRVNWRLEVEVYRNDEGSLGVGDLLLTPNPLIYASPADGDINIDVSTILASQFDFDSVLPLSLDQGGVFADFGRFIAFYIKTTEVFDGSSESQKDDSSIFTGFAVAASLDQNDKYGSNLADFVPHDNRPVGQKAKYLQKMSRPAIWRGQPWGVHFCYPILVTSSAELEYFDAGGNTLSTETVTVPTGRYLGKMMADISAVPATAVTAELQMIRSATNEMELLTIDIFDPCENPVYIEWVNSLGGDSYWMFDFNYARTIGAENIEDILVNATNYLADQERYTQTGGDRLVDLALTAKDIPVNNWEALSEILSSPRVNWIISVDGNTFRRVSVRVTSKTASRDVRQSFNNFEITIGLPRREAQK